MKKSHTQETQSAQGTSYRSAAAQLRKDKAKIKTTWEKKVRAKVAMAESQTSLALLNSMEVFLDELATAIEQSILISTYDMGEKGMSKLYGEQRARFAGYFLPQLLKEFSILREVITIDLHEANVLTFHVGLVINSAIDSAISLASTEFTAVHQKNIKIALEKAETSNKELEHFAAVAAHDLKSPLATISGYLDLILDAAKDRLEKKSIEYIYVVQNASERMRRLIDRLLDYARLTSSPTQFQSVNINNVMTSVLQDLHRATEETHAEIIYGLLPIVKGDPDLLTQLFQNLIANSLKFHGPQLPTVHLNFKIQEDMILFTLKDNGIGFDPKDKEDIFALYKKLRGEVEYQGAGIGLATCRKVVELHGGKIWAESTPGLGSTFYFTLPNPATPSF